MKLISSKGICMEWVIGASLQRSMSIVRVFLAKTSMTAVFSNTNTCRFFYEEMVSTKNI
jgi:hypothetical protein